MAKVLVTGGAGFIGSHIVDAMIAAKHQVLVVDNLSSGKRENLPHDVPLLPLDVRDAEFRNRVEAERPEVIVHAAAQISVRESMRDPLFDVQVNVGGIVNLLCACQRPYSPHVVFISTGGAMYGEQETFPAPENHVIRPNSIYGQSKRVSEIYLEFWAREMGLSYTALRLANVYGPRQNPHGEAGVVAIFSESLISGKVPTIYGAGDQTRDFVYVKDVARAVQTVADRKIPGIFNIGTGIETSVNALYAMIAQSLGSGVKAKYAPKKEGEQMRSSIDSALAQKTFGWRPQVTIGDGIGQTANWFREQAC
jgi:UDP-glucose 4-epimerase